MPFDRGADVLLPGRNSGRLKTCDLEVSSELGECRVDRSSQVLLRSSNPEKDCWDQFRTRLRLVWRAGKIGSDEEPDEPTLETTHSTRRFRIIGMSVLYHP